MDELIQTLNMDFTQLFINIIIILVAIVFVVNIIEKASIIIGKPFKWIMKNDDDHELLVKLDEKNDEFEKALTKISSDMNTANEEIKTQIQHQYDSNLKYRNISIDERARLDGRIDAMAKLDEHRDEIIDQIGSNLKKLTDMFIDKQINDYRWEIINFASNVAAGKPCTKDAYVHCQKTYEKYEKVLEENGLENGEVEISMEIINESFKKKLLEGFDSE